MIKYLLPNIWFSVAGAATASLAGAFMGRKRRGQQAEDLHLATIEALARAIDAKDQMTELHIRHVQIYAAGLARAAGLSETAIQGVKTAALLHDIGNLAVPEPILSKPGPLVQEEFQKIRIHPQIGADIIASVPFPYPVAPLILSHHERWDGKGYPQGLRGEEIPLGARILTVVDYYDAVTTDRPYHKALSHERAIALLEHEAGRALDPRLVPIFIDILPNLVAEVAVIEAMERPKGIARAAENGRPASPPPTAFENIALAQREIHALYDIAQAMGTSLGIADTMSLITAKLSRIIPWSGCALFLHQPESQTLRCRFAEGADTATILDAQFAATGALAESVRTGAVLVNVDPRAMFEAAGMPVDTPLTSAIVCPLRIDQTFIGVLALFHVEPRCYTEDHSRLLARVAEQGGAVINNAMVFEQAQEASLTDALTTLPNRRSLYAHLARELSRAGRMKTELAIMLLDVDGFKEINDAYGHHIGDDALRAVAKTLQAGLRTYDICVRYAGDEFIVVLAECPASGAETKRRELQQRISEIELQVQGDKTVRLAASAGCAIFPQDGSTSDSLLAAADQRMYRDKAVRHAQRGTPVRRRASSEPAASGF